MSINIHLVTPWPLYGNCIPFDAIQITVKKSRKKVWLFSQASSIWRPDKTAYAFRVHHLILISRDNL